KYATEAGMKLAVVTGQIVCTVRHHGLAHDKLLMVEMIDPQGNPDGQCAVAIDNIGAGTGEWVLLVSGSSARQAHKSETSPVDLCVIGIVDEVVSGGQVIFHK
ncbi:ethanolamine utilization microcompartment protein EutN, partial [Bifidobacterium dentium]|nr:ethanolamine utilization microcompartment protein EutN [Bifidobacterium dentium]